MENHHRPPTGFRFYPTEEELVGFYLQSQLEGQRNDINRVIPVLDINGIEPWNLPPLAGELCRGETEQWFFFAPRQERESRGGRINRTTASGYWKATGSPGYVYSSDNKVIGVKKTMVFYKGRAPSGRKTKWKMHEYRAIHQLPNQSTTATPKLRHEFSLCRVYVISGSFRAFDRRPPEVVSRVVVGLRGEGSSSSAHQQQQDEGASMMVADENDGSSSPETSHSPGGGGGGGGDQSGGGAASWNDASGGVDVEEPLWEWEWEQLNWL